ncbi:MAG TPA: homogentisate phytyltransferase [Bacteroidetes bacterium]|nr:homogentisate phytyltransferase [Bacteroidota bacterium]
MIGLNALWKFSRPHTIIGSVISIVTLYYIVYRVQGIFNLPFLLMALGTGISCNIFIVGINQIADVNIDKINKPYLPIPSGLLSVRKARIVVFTALIISLIFALWISPYLFGIVALSTAIGWAYSMPPLYLKRHHVSAALAIATVRGILLNAGGFLVFNYEINHSLEMPVNVVILTYFILAFSIVISWFKDLSDMEGDAKYQIKTLAIQYSPRAALITGNLVVAAAYLFTLYMKWDDFFNAETPTYETRVLFIGHLVLFGCFILNALSIRPGELQSIKKFYKRFWWFFFAEYAVYLLAYAVEAF